MAEAIKNVGVAGLIAGVIFGVIFGVIMLLFAGMTASVFQNMGVDIVGLFSILVVAVVILYPILAVVFFLIQSAILFISAKLFGGKGDFTTPTHLISLPYAALVSIDALLSIPGMIPFIGFFFFILSFLIPIYALSPLTTALKEAHDYGTIRAVLTWFAPFIAIMVLLVILIILLLSPLFHHSQQLLHNPLPYYPGYH